MESFNKALRERFTLQQEYLGNDKPVNHIQPLVSITVTTYQHAPYIRDCLNGILMQQVCFPYEIIIGEDGSLDGTREICEEYAEKYPDKIRLFNRDRSLSQFKCSDGKVRRFNGLWNRMSVRGKYIAWCEGDDYWIDPLKLQKQVDYLENHPECGLVHTQAQVYVEKDKSFKAHPIGYSFDNVDQLIVENKISTLTTCFRTDLYRQYERDVIPPFSWKMGDYPLWIFIASQSDVYFLNEITAVYRELECSASHSKSMSRTIEFYYSIYCISSYFAEILGRTYLLSKIKSNFLIKIIYAYAIKNANVDKALLLWFKYIKCTVFKPYFLLFISCFKFGRYYLKRRILLVI